MWLCPLRPQATARRHTYNQGVVSHPYGSHRLWEGGGPRPALSVIASHSGHETVPSARQSTVHKCTRPRLTLGPEAQQ